MPRGTWQSSTRACGATRAGVFMFASKSERRSSGYLSALAAYSPSASRDLANYVQAELSMGLRQVASTENFRVPVGVDAHFPLTTTRKTKPCLYGNGITLRKMFMFCSPFLLFLLFLYVASTYRKRAAEGQQQRLPLHTQKDVNDPPNYGRL